MTTEELIAELRVTVDHDVALGLKPPLHAEIRALLDRIASLEAALAPFARVFVPKPWPDDEPVLDESLTAGDFRRAAALSSSKQKDGGE